MEPRNVIVGKRRGSDAVEIISGPEIRIAEQDSKFLPFRLNRSNADFEWAALCRLEVERIERFDMPAVASVPEQSTKKAKSK